MFSTAAEPEAVATTTELAKGYMTRGERVVNLLDQAVGSAGWPLLILAGIGAWRVWRRGTRDRLTSALLAWAIVWVVFSASTVFSKVDQEYVRYAAEFLGRINLATMPLLAILAGYGAAAGWDTAHAIVSTAAAATHRHRAHRRSSGPRGARMAAVV